MRITGGTLKGYKIIVPSGYRLRPSQDIVRKAIFDILDHSLMPADTADNEPDGDEPVSSPPYRLVLDLYAGTGALGIEALSRGAHFVDFVERNATAVDAIYQNLTRTHLQEKADIYQQKAEDFVLLDRPEKYDLIFLDPPYADEPRQVLFALPTLLNHNGLAIYLHSKRLNLKKNFPDLLERGLRVIDNRRYGATTVTFLGPREAT